MVDKSSRNVALALLVMPLLLAVAVGFLYFSGRATPAAEFGSVQVVGSQTMRPVITACAEDFMGQNPEADIIVNGGGSGDGVAALLHGVADIGIISRDLSDREREYARSQGIEISEFALALDGVAFIVNGTNAVSALGLSELRDIFSGGVRNWRQLGGADSKIEVFVRAAGSGTASLFDERVMDGDGYAPSARQLPTNEAIVAEVASSPHAVGYTGLGALGGSRDRVEVIPLRKEGVATPIAPTEAEIRSGNYPLARKLYLNAAGAPSGTVGAFIDFCAGVSGQALLRKAGYVLIAPMVRQ
jgi:phosphate transport system substrate-binding protein